MLSRILPAPKNVQRDKTVVEDVEGDEDFTVPSSSSATTSTAAKRNKGIPSYPNRKGFIPTTLEDFEDGGAYPELHVVQYPLHMGKPGQKSAALVPVQIDDNGTIRTDMVIRQGTNRHKQIQTQLSDIKPKAMTAEEIAMPDEKEQQATTERTKQALEAILEGKIKSAKPTGNVTSGGNKDIVEANYVRYTPNPNAPGANPATQQRVIKMVEAQVDPMEPARHKHQVVARAGNSPPVPVLHSPPRKLTVEDQQAWKIPPCISNWKNARGFIIPLDKRLAADGRGLQEFTINNKFATLSESLYIAERKAVQDLNIRNELRKNIALREKEEREQNLREMANRARLERSGALRPDDDEDRGHLTAARGGRSDDDDDFSNSDRDNSDDEFAGETEEDRIARQQRERIRLERRKDREREMRLANMKGNMRKNKADRDEDRDVSEKIALGMLKGTGKLTGESLYDSRLFNQTSGMDAGFGAEDEYNTYSRPLFDRGEGGSIYRPKKSDGEIYGDADEQMAKLTDTSRFRPDKGFKGADGRNSAGPRDAPVQFETMREGDDRRDDGRDERRSKKARHDSDDE